MSDLTVLPNIGREMARKLTAAGIPSAEALADMGAEEAYLRLRLLYPKVCLVHLQALEGAVRGVPFQFLPQERKRELKTFHDGLGQAAP